MTHIKCLNCGLVNLPDAEVCERCGKAIERAETGTQESSSTRANVPEFTFGRDLPKDSKIGKVILIVVVVLAVAGGGWMLYKAIDSRQRSRAEARRKSRPTPPPSVEERTRTALLSCLAQPGFVGTKFVDQVLGPATLEMLHVPDQEVYFTTPAQEKTGQTFEEIVARFTVDQKRIVLGQDDGSGRLRIGDYSMLRSVDKDMFFKTAVDNIKFDPGIVLKFPFKQATYTLNIHELEDFLQNKSIFGGRIQARTEHLVQGRTVVFANHGALVGRPEESSLRRFVEDLTRDIPVNGNNAREARVQRVLDFVSREIKYDLREATYNFELLKRPNEVLMSGESDCSNKTILLGSLLEQLGEDYLFVYTPDHITVAVRKGNFPTSNGLVFEWEKETWAIAEGTAPGFRIGLDRVREEKRFKQFRHVQRPRDRDVIFDMESGRQLSFH